MSQFSSIVKLNKDNYGTCKIQIEAILIKNDVLDYDNGKSVKPKTDNAEWIKDDQKAKADIILSMDPSELSHVKNCSTSKEVWDKLETVYESKGPARKAMLLKRLLFLKMKTDDMADLKNFS